MEQKITQELIEKAKAMGRPEEIMKLAKEAGVELTIEEAQAYFSQLHNTGELPDDELDNVAGGGCGGGGYPPCPVCGGKVLKVPHSNYLYCTACGWDNLKGW